MLITIIATRQLAPTAMFANIRLRHAFSSSSNLLPTNVMIAITIPVNATAL